METIPASGLSPSRARERVLVIWDRPEVFEDLLRERFPRVQFEFAATESQVRSALERQNPRVVFTIRHERIPGECHRIAACHPGLAWIQVGGSGYEHLSGVDLAGMQVTNAAGVLAPFLAETVTGAMLAWNNRLFQYRDQQRCANWCPLPFTPLRDKTLVVLGVGAIGGCVAANASSLGLRVLGVNRTARRDSNFDRMFALADAAEALAQADIVSVHLRLNQETEYFVGHDLLEAVKPGAFFINTSRGGVVDTRALLDALDSGRLSGVYLDVFEREPLPAGHPLWEMDNVLITPHAADQVEDWPRRFAAFFADNLDRWLAGRALVNRVE